MAKQVDRLKNACVHIGGVGRIGSSIALALHAAGVGTISCNDPQRFDQEQLESYAYARRSDVGRFKVHVLERFLAGRPGGVLLPVSATNESRQITPYIEKADLIISCANRLAARRYLEKEAIRCGKPSIQVSAQDARKGLGGMITTWAPTAGGACFGCFVTSIKPRFRRGEVLVPTVTGTIGQLAANLAVQMLAGNAKEIVQRHNLFVLDLGGYSLDRFAIARHRECEICKRS